MQLLARGRTHQQVADELGHANRGTVHRIVRQALKTHEADNVKFFRHVELDRLRALHAALWDDAV